MDAIKPTAASTTELLERAQQGEDAARELLFGRCRPLLRRWARGRLPGFARDLADTDDIVQTTLLRAYGNLERFEQRESGSFLAYLRTIMLNVVKEELRRHGRRPEETERLDAANDGADVVLQNVMRQDTLDRYEQALAQLGAAQRQAVVLRLEFGLSFPELALELGSPSSNAVRMQVSRSLVQLAELMEKQG